MGLKRGEIAIGAGVVALLLFVVAFNLYYILGTGATVTATVSRVERITTGSGETLSSKYLVYTDQGTFENTDSLFWGKWNSSDLHGELHDGRTYHLDYYGWRVPFLSMYPNIVTANPTE